MGISNLPPSRPNSYSKPESSNVQDVSTVTIEINNKREQVRKDQVRKKALEFAKLATKQGLTNNPELYSETIFEDLWEAMLEVQRRQEKKQKKQKKKS